MAQCSISPRKQSIGRYFLTGMALAVTGFVSAGLAVLVVWLTMRDNAEFGALGLALGAAMLGYPLGVIGGLFVLKRVLKIPGGMALGIVGAIVGVALCLGLAAFLNQTTDPGTTVVLYFILSPSLAAVGLRLGDRKRSSSAHK